MDSNTDKVSNTTRTEISIQGSSLMDFLRVLELITGKIYHIIEEILNKASEMVMVFGQLLKKNNTIKGTICSIENMVMAFMIGEMDIFIKEISLRIKDAVKDSSILMISLFIVDFG